MEGGTMSTVYATLRGLAIEGTVDYSPEEGPSYSCGGVPACWDAETESVEIEDEEEFSEWDITLEDAIVAWEDDILTALCDAY
jgi:hypothetical protein